MEWTKGVRGQAWPSNGGAKWLAKRGEARRLWAAFVKQTLKSGPSVLAAEHGRAIKVPGGWRRGKNVAGLANLCEGKLFQIICKLRA